MNCVIWPKSSKMVQYRLMTISVFQAVLFEKRLKWHLNDFEYFKTCWNYLRLWWICRRHLTQALNNWKKFDGSPLFPLPFLNFVMQIFERMKREMSNASNATFSNINFSRVSQVSQAWWNNIVQPKKESKNGQRVMTTFTARLEVILSYQN